MPRQASLPPLNPSPSHHPVVLSSLPSFPALSYLGEAAQASPAGNGEGKRGNRGRRGNRILGGDASCTRKTDQAMRKEVGNFLRKQSGNRHLMLG